MVKGHMQDGKFHPHTDYKKGVRKSRDQQAKTQGIRLRRESANEIFGQFPAHGKSSTKCKDCGKIYSNYDFDTSDDALREFRKHLQTHSRKARDKKSEFEQFLKNIDNHEGFYLGRLDVILEDPRLEMTPDHVVAKIDHEIAKPIFEYKMANKLKLKPNTEPDLTHGKIYWDFHSNTEVTEKSLKRIAVDAHLQGLIPNNRVETLLDKAEFQTHKERANRPIIISLKNTNWIVAPYDKAFAEQLEKETMKVVVAEHKAEHKRNQL